MERNLFKNECFILSPVLDFSVITGEIFCSGDADIDDFFINDAERHFLDNMAVTYRMSLLDDESPLAFVSLQNDSIQLKDEGTKQKIGYKYKSLPAVKVGRIGVQKDMQGTGTGTALLAMLKAFMLKGSRAGCRFITLDAYNRPEVIQFYRKNGFLCLKEPAPGRKTVPMYFDLHSQQR